MKIGEFSNQYFFSVLKQAAERLVHTNEEVVDIFLGYVEGFSQMEWLFKKIPYMFNMIHVCFLASSSFASLLFIFQWWVEY